MEEFNLLDGPWIKVLTLEDEEKEVSMLEFFKNVQNYRSFAGELPHQDFAVMRLMLAVLMTVFTRWDAKGNLYSKDFMDWDTFELNERNLNEFNEQLMNTWLELWNRGSFPDCVLEYLEFWRHRFNLFDEERPFMQFPHIGEEGYKYSARRLPEVQIDGLTADGQVDKPTLFASKSRCKVNFLDGGKVEEKVDILTNGELVRWLLYINGFQEANSGRVKKGSKKRFSTGVAYLGSLGIVLVEGSTLYETLMLNFNLGGQKLYEGKNYLNKQKPLWENEDLFEESFRKKPDNLAQLYTYPHRLLLLKRRYFPEVSQRRVMCYLDLSSPEEVEDEGVIGYEGLHYPSAYYLEPFTQFIYKKISKDSGFYKVNGYDSDQMAWEFKRYTKSSFLWQEFPTMLVSFETEATSPGVLKWLRKLSDEGLDLTQVVFKKLQINYGSKGSKPSSLEWDVMSEHVNLVYGNFGVFEDNGYRYLKEEVELIELCVKCLEKLITRVSKALGVSKDKVSKDVIENVYSDIDKDFREWLSGVDIRGGKAGLQESKIIWLNTLEKYFLSVGRTLCKRYELKMYLNKETLKGGKANSIFEEYVDYERGIRKVLR